MGEFFQERPYTASAAKASGKATLPHNLSPLSPAPHFLLDTSPILGVCYPPTFYFSAMKKFPLLLSLLAMFTLPADAKTKIACVGDSITFGYQIPNRETNNYPYFLQQLLGDKYEVRNFGNSGKTAGDFPGQPGRWYGSTKEHKDAVAFKGDLYICNLGINDTGKWWNAELFEQGYLTLIDQWRGSRKNTPVIIWTKLAPDFRGPAGKEAFPGNVFAPEFTFPASDNGSSAKRLEDEGILQKIAKAKKTSVMDAYTPLAKHPEWYNKDGLHPISPGAKRIAQLTCSAIFRVKPWKQSAPLLAAEGDSLRVTNGGSQALVLDFGVLKSKQGVSFIFGEGSVLGAGESVSIEFSATQNANDFGAPLTTQSPLAEDVAFVPANYKNITKPQKRATAWEKGKSAARKAK